MTNCMYKVPLIGQNLRQDETVLQIGDTLKHLSYVSKDIFSRINTRIEQNRQNLKRLEKRIGEVNDKVKQLNGAKKATRIFSSSSYPASNVHKQYETLFDTSTGIELQRSKVALEAIHLKDDFVETLQFYHVRANESSSKNFAGLGSIPPDLQSTNDLFLLNSSTNPYKNYTLFDPLQNTPNVKRDNDQEKISGIGEAPRSISDRKSFGNPTSETYFYSPDLGQVPSIDVPVDLPDLPGIADDLRYVNTYEPGIAPSVMISSNVSQSKVVEQSIPDNVDEVFLILPEPPAEPSIVPKLELPVVKEAEVSQEVLTFEPVISPPKIETQQAPTVLNQPSLIDDSRSSLMEAIRKAGGSKNLKAVQEKNNVTVAPKSTGNLMADLHNKLSLRRKGISGAAKRDDTSENKSGFDVQSTMSKISALIRAPSPTNKSESSNSEDQEDWEP